MLILGRKVNERIRIGDSGYVTVTAIKGNCVSLGLDFPIQVHIVREELITRRQKQEDCDEDLF